MNLLLGEALAARCHAQAEGDILEDGHVVEEGVALEDESCLTFVRVLERDILTMEMDLPLVRKFQPGDDPKECCLSRSAGAKEGHHFAGFDTEGYVVHRRERSEALA